MLNILFALCLITTSFTIECMEKLILNPFKKNGNGHSNGHSNNNGYNNNGNDKKIEKRTIRSHSHSNLSSSINEQPNNSIKTSSINNKSIITPPAEHPFITAIKTNNREIINNFLNYPLTAFDPNIHHNGSGTSFHICIETCVKNKDFSLLEQLISDPRLDTTETTKDSKAKTGQSALKEHKQHTDDLILKEKISQWASRLFKRWMLDSTIKGILFITDTKTQKTYFDPKLIELYLNGNISNAIINEIKNEALKKIHNIANDQNKSEDRQLPFASCLPSETTLPRFIENKIWFMIIKNSTLTNSTPTIK